MGLKWIIGGATAFALTILGVGVWSLLAPVPDEARAPWLLTCRFEAPIRTEAGELALPQDFEIEHNGAYGRSYLRMEGRQESLSIIRYDDGREEIRNASSDPAEQPFTLYLAPDLGFEMTLWDGAATEIAYAEGHGHCLIRTGEPV